MSTSETPVIITEPGLHISITHAPLNASTTLSHIRSPSAGALVLFIGTTRNTFDERTVTSLSYTSYVPLALQTMVSIAKSVKSKHNLLGVAITHRLGEVGVGEESIHVAVAGTHRQEAWRAGEEALEAVKERVEIWKMERFEDGGVWRANRDGAAGTEVVGETIGETIMERVGGVGQ